MKSRMLAAVGLLLILACSAGMVRLMSLRFSQGDVFPPYSSLRADPLGARALYEAFEACCGLTVRRNYEPASRIKSLKDTTIFLLGLSPAAIYGVPETAFSDIETFVRNGGRLVITFPPLQDLFSVEEVLKQITQQEKVRSLPNEWGFHINTSSLNSHQRDTAQRQSKNADLPESMSWHSAIVLDSLDPPWTILYERENHPVIIERTLGKGSVILSTDSYFFSNEAMVKERYPGLLSYFAGPHKTILFDEYHHGIASSPGVVSLARKYRLEWLFLGILILAALFIWMNAVPFVPPLEEGSRSETQGWARGMESVSGLTNLLRRNIPAKKILSVCWEQWKKTGMTEKEDKRKKLEALMSSGDKSSVELYNRMNRVWTGKS